MYKQYTFSEPPPPHSKVYRPTFLGSKTRVLHSTTFIVQQQKLTRLQSLQCDKWYLWLCIMSYRLQLIVYTSKFNLNIYFLWIQRKYVQFHNMRFKMLKYQLLIGLETSFKNWQKAQNVNIYFPSKVDIWSYPLVYGLYTCENVDNYGWPLTMVTGRYHLVSTFQKNVSNSHCQSVIVISELNSQIWMFTALVYYTIYDCFLLTISKWEELAVHTIIQLGNWTNALKRSMGDAFI